MNLLFKTLRVNILEQRAKIYEGNSSMTLKIIKRLIAIPALK